MNLIDRYLHEVGRFLPRKTRDDILIELRSHLTDTLEQRVKGEASEEEIVALLKEFGPPQKLAASYSGDRQYLIGPELYPLFKMIAGIVLAAVIGAQLLAFGVTVALGENSLHSWETLVGLLMSIPTAIGWLVIVFIILQRFNVEPKLDDKPWDPRTLPVIKESEAIKRGERIFGIVGGIVILAVLVFLPDKIGFVNFPGGEFYPNPVILQYLGWICLSLVAGVGLDIWLLWQGRWTIGSRVARIAVNFLSVGVLALLLAGHNSWLSAHGAGGFLADVEKFAVNVDGYWQLMGMQAFRLAFGIALLVTIIETGVQLFKLVRDVVKKDPVPELAGK